MADRRGDPLIAAAPADVAGHALDDVLIGQVRLRGDHRRRLHDLAALAEAALRHVQLAPRDLDRMVAIRAQPFDGGDLDALGVSHRDEAGSRRLAVDMHGAGAAEPGAAAIFGPGETKFVAQIPKQRHVGITVELTAIPVDTETDHLLLPAPFQGFRQQLPFVRYGRNLPEAGEIAIRKRTLPVHISGCL
jgi:hypothetical protein